MNNYTYYIIYYIFIIQKYNIFFNIYIYLHLCYTHLNHNRRCFKMQSILEQLYYGRLSPQERRCAPDAVGSALRDDFIDHCDAFAQRLDQFDPSLRQGFNRILDEQPCLMDGEFARLYVDGFRTGARMMLEILAPSAEE